MSIYENDSQFLDDLHKIQVKLLAAFAECCNRHDIQWWIDFGTLLGAIRHEGKFIPWDDDLDVSMTREDYRRFLEVAHELPSDIFVQTAATDPHYDIYMVEAKLRDCNSTFIENPEGKYHQGVYIDIFPYDKTFRDSAQRKKHHRQYKSRIVGYRQNVVTSLPLWKDMRPLRKVLLSLKYRFISIEKEERRVLDRYKKDSNWVWRPTLASKIDDTPIENSALFPLKKMIFEGVTVTVPSDCDAHLTALYGDWQKLPPEDQQKPAHCRGGFDLNKPWEPKK